MSDDDSIDFDITISGSRKILALSNARRLEGFLFKARRRQSVGFPATPPPPSRKQTWMDRVHSRLAFCALCVFVLFIVVGLVLLFSNIQERPP
ncbi:unnamed protein product [Haemonchus placei]|uniref:LEM domain-containing protein n=1 Tax=Haemonchus placei TaxID=6290 RepID=A0A0N4WHG4_HAEPC|nr:unnamed protein product [Haemonchus placei]